MKMKELIIFLFLVFLIFPNLALVIGSEIKYENCEQLFYNGYSSGYYDIYPDGQIKIEAYCYMDSEHGWTIIDPNHDSAWLDFFYPLVDYGPAYGTEYGNKSSPSYWTWREWFNLSTPQTKFARSPNCQSISEQNKIYRITGNYYNCLWYNDNCNFDGSCHWCLDGYDSEYSWGTCPWLPNASFIGDGPDGSYYPYSCSYDWWNSAPSLGKGDHCVAYYEPIDLSISSAESIKPIQVIEDVDFIENKPVMVRVSVSLNNTPIVTTKVKLEILDGGTPVWSGYAKDEEGNENIIIKKEYSSEEQKLGEDTVNFFPTRDGNWKPSTGTYTFNVTIDPDNTIKEDNEGNNEKTSDSVEVKGQKDENYHIVWMSLEAGLWAELFGVTGFQEAYKRNKDFFNSVYPLSDVYHTVSEADPPDWLPYNNYILIAWLSTIRRLGGGDFGGGVDRIVGVVPRKADLGGAAGLSYSGDNLCYPAVLIAAEGEDYAVATHEIGHTYGLDDEYNGNIGESVDRGWCLNIDSGKSCDEELSKAPGGGVNLPEGKQINLIEGARVNIYPPTNFLERISYFEDSKIVEEFYPYFYNIMGDDGTAAWVHKEAYNELLEKLTQ